MTYHPMVLQLVQNAIADLMVLGEEEARARGIQAVGGLNSQIPAFRAAARLEQAIVLIVEPDRAIEAAINTGKGAHV